MSAPGPDLPPLPEVESTEAPYRILEAGDVETAPHEEFALHVLEGLSEHPKRLSSRFIYDDRGSQLFQDIMHLKEYYPTRCEADILRQHGKDILQELDGESFNLVDLGAGDGAKTLLLLSQLQERGADFTYVPIDISAGAIEGLARKLARESPGLAVHGLVAEYSAALRWLNTQASGRRNLVLFLGSNIGNFNRAQARTFLRRLWAGLNHGDLLLVGFDLKKDIDKLLAAYNDRAGITAQFNLNLLARINAELGGNFDLKRFRHYATYDVFTGAMESYLVSLADQDVTVAAVNSTFHFNAWEPVHTEYSYKYLPADIESLSLATGFEIAANYSDKRRWFTDSLWRVIKED